MPLAVTGASYAADGALLVTSNKTSVDHLVSMVSKQDCAFWRVFEGGAICVERQDKRDPYDVDYNHAERTVAEDGERYLPPLRPAANAPAASWDAASYEVAATPLASPSLASPAAIAPPAPRASGTASRSAIRKP